MFLNRHRCSKLWEMGETVTVRILKGANQYATLVILVKLKGLAFETNRISNRVRVPSLMMWTGPLSSERQPALNCQFKTCLHWSISDLSKWSSHICVARHDDRPRAVNGPR